jgi:hypothetical protein
MLCDSAVRPRAAGVLSKIDVLFIYTCIPTIHSGLYASSLRLICTGMLYGSEVEALP